MTDHLSALRLRLSHERVRLAAARTAGERELRAVWVSGGRAGDRGRGGVRYGIQSGSYKMTQDTSAVFSREMLDEDHACAFAKPWLFETEFDITEFATEAEACAEQRFLA